MSCTYSFCDSIVDTETFHIQLEWFNKQLDLNDLQISTDTEYGCITVTNLKDYWQRTITHGLLMDCFKVSNALIEKERNNVLVAAFLGEQSLYKDRLEWRVTREGDRLRMKLRTYNADIAFAAGSFNLTKVSEIEIKKLQELWFRRCSLASQVSIEKSRALKQCNSDLERTNAELKETIESMIIRENKNKLLMIEKFVNLLNTKKKKIKKLEKIIAQKRWRDDEEEEEEKNQSSQKRNKSKQESSSLPIQGTEMSLSMPQTSTSLNIKESVKILKPITATMAIINDFLNDESDFSEDDIDCPQTV
ncbi:uncharacterized protein BX663DRAFT_499398, partial [Cokeromyces recurvatus]|uniref:uncharacterized protein n=1 Tax=Cokeromyces recurvatus TaxID=90255 RepID=UPI00221F6D3E